MTFLRKASATVCFVRCGVPSASCFSHNKSLITLTERSLETSRKYVFLLTQLRKLVITKLLTRCLMTLAPQTTVPPDCMLLDNMSGMFAIVWVCCLTFCQQDSLVHCTGMTFCQQHISTSSQLLTPQL